MRNRLPPLNPLRAFEAAARCGTVSAAADELHVTASAVSHQIRILESTLWGEVLSLALSDMVQRAREAPSDKADRVSGGFAKHRAK